MSLRQHHSRSLSTHSMSELSTFSHHLLFLAMFSRGTSCFSLFGHKICTSLTIDINQTLPPQSSMLCVTMEQLRERERVQLRLWTLLKPLTLQMNFLSRYFSFFFPSLFLACLPNYCMRWPPQLHFALTNNMALRSSTGSNTTREASSSLHNAH